MLHDGHASRRNFLGGLGATSAAVLMSDLFALGKAFGEAAGDDGLHVASNAYPWYTYYRRENRDFNADLDAGLADVAAAGLQGFEALLGSPDDVARYAPLLKKHGLEMRSFYIGLPLHDKEAANASIEQILVTADKAKAELNTGIVVINPAPLSWNRETGRADKTDEQLEVQADALNRLGAALRERGMVLALHNHDMELRNAAREFQHMMLATDPNNLTLCLDAHWMYRGSGNSQVFLFDIVKLYGKRVSEIHFRQSQDGVWTEAFGPGDIDYARLAR
ncbi:MAG: TIM barrel protein, partial [Thermogutta sp.]|nr:TIM barrel protein [Thermogutta sp.]